MKRASASRPRRGSPDADRRSAPAARRLGREHFAFFRAVLEGVDLRLAADHYLEPGVDLRVAKATWRWIRDALRVAALRHGRRGEQHLLALSPKALEEAGLSEGDPPTREPTTYEAWRARLPPDAGDFGEAELYAQFLAETRSSGAAVSRRRGRGERAAALRARQRALFTRLEQLLVAAPDPRDPVGAWFRPALAARLSAAGLETLRTLAETIQGRGYRWWVHVPRLGEQGAREVLAWLQAHEEAIGVRLRSHALAPRRTLAPAALAAERAPRPGSLAPLERFIVPAALDGSRGENRADPARNRLRARNDLEAIHAWLALYPPTSHTWRAYRREAERFLLWAVLERGRALSSLTVEDCVAYRDFLHDPQPRDRWVGRRHVERWHTGWRPFEGPLATRSIAHATTILRALAQWLTDQRYLDSNPWKGVPRPRARAITMRAGRSLTQAQWRYALGALGEWPEGEARARLGFALLFLYATGLRLAEAVAARIEHLEQRDLARDLRQVWILHVLGKGRVEREVPVPRAAIEALGLYLGARGLPKQPLRCDPSEPLIAKLSERARARAEGGRALSPSALYKLLTRYFQWAAMGLAKSDPDGAARLRRASTHWLRHTHGSHALAAGASAQTVRDNLGHASLATTSIYSTGELARRYREIEVLVE